MRVRSVSSLQTRMVLISTNDCIKKYANSVKHLGTLHCKVTQYFDPHSFRKFVWPKKCEYYVAIEDVDQRQQAAALPELSSRCKRVGLFHETLINRVPAAGGASFSQAYAGRSGIAASIKAGIWAPPISTGLQDGVIALELAGSLWFGNDNQFKGHTWLGKTMMRRLISGSARTALELRVQAARDPPR